VIRASVGCSWAVCRHSEKRLDDSYIVAETAILIVARKDFPPRDLAEFMSFARANSEKLNMAHGGVGSVMHFTCLLLNSILNVKPTMVPFNSGALAMNALLAGHVDYACGHTPDVVPQVQGGTIKAYAISTTQRNPGMPNIPTTKEAGLPEFRTSAWFALFAPKGTPKAVVDTLTDALDKALDDENTHKQILEIGDDVPDKSTRGQKALATLVKTEIARWTPIIKAANIKGE
jgi:putative tricarboxylic transport membrane protein